MKSNRERPQFAIVCPNALTVIGLRQLLQSVMSTIEVVAYPSVQELREDNPERFFHFFVEFNMLLTDRQFFLERKNKTIVLTTQADLQALLAQFHCLNVNVPEKQLVKSLLMTQQKGHSQGKSMPPMAKKEKKSILSPREVEVLALLAQGFINKEIADKLNISLTTVISHRKNITEKLGMRSVSALTIYAVMNGYVSIDKI